MSIPTHGANQGAEIDAYISPYAKEEPMSLDPPKIAVQGQEVEDAQSISIGSTLHRSSSDFCKSQPIDEPSLRRVSSRRKAEHPLKTSKSPSRPPSAQKLRKNFVGVLESFVRHVASVEPNVVSWTGDGSGFFLNELEDPQALNVAISKFFWYGRYPSLRRQLNVYGFKKYKRSHRYKGAFHHPSIHRNMTNWQSLMLKPIVRPSRASKSKNAPFLRHGKPVDEKPSPASPPNRMGEKAAISSLTGKCALEKLNIPSSDGSYAGLPVVSGRTDRAALTSASSGTEAALEEYGMYDKYHNLISGGNEGADVGETEETSFSMEYTTPSEIKPQIGLFDPVSYLEGGGFSEKRDLRTLADAAELAAAKGWNTNLTKYSPVIRADCKENDTPIHAIYTRDLGSLWDKSPAAVRMQFDSTTPLVSASPIDPGVRKNIGKYPHPGMPDYSPSFITSVLERSGATLWTPNFDDKEIDIPSPPMEQWFSPPKFPSLPMHKSFSPGKNLDLDTLETYVTRIDIESKKRKRSTVLCSPPYLSPDSPTMTFEDFCSVSSEISFSTERLSGEAEICTASS